MTVLNNSFFPIETLEIRSFDATRVAETLSSSKFMTARLSGRGFASNSKGRAQHCPGEWGIVRGCGGRNGWRSAAFMPLHRSPARALPDAESWRLRELKRINAALRPPAAMTPAFTDPLPRRRGRKGASGHCPVCSGAVPGYARGEKNKKTVDIPCRMPKLHKERHFYL